VSHRAAALAAGQAITEADTGTEMSIAKVTAISAYSKGFCCSCGPGVAYLFEKTDDKEFYRKSREFRVFFNDLNDFKIRNVYYSISCMQKNFRNFFK
jgi:hypothetical protein